ncbi:MAG: HNH endonuclease domain-containing protein [Candidatus Anstonellales archaeon]
MKRITQECERFFGKTKWQELSESEQSQIIESIKNELQSFFHDKKREYKKLPRLMDDLKQFLKDNFDFLDDKKLNTLYHPSAIDIYPKLTERDKATDGKLYLQSPKTGSWKNPMAMRVLEELRRLINYLIQTEQIDEETKIIVEIPRELNDANKRKAYEIWQKRREEENKEFAIAIAELIKQHPNIKANENNDSDIDKFRMWYEQCYNEVSKEFTDKGPNELKKEKKKNKKGEETNEEVGIWSENRFSNINTSLWFKIQKAKENVLEKYKLWNEQKAMCIYTGKMISLSDLFNEDTIDIEHTLPFSRSFDNSLTNKTVCFKEYNRKIKKNSIPAECPNYDEILYRIKPWEEKIENIKKHLEFWKNESKNPKKTPERKNQCIVEKHLWTMELEYWQNKVERFKMKEITSNFVNAQLVETQLISKYAFHYLKTLFENVQVQKGSVTAEFAKILGLREKYKSKIRDKHTHHTLDAFVLSLIPDSARLKSILEKNAEIDELKKINENTDANERSINQARIELLQKEINQLLIESRIPVNTLHKIANKIENNTIAITPTRTREKIFATSKKKIKRGKFKGKYATGDVVRGQLHKESFYGKIKLVKRDESGKPLRNENGEWIWQKDKKGNEEFAFVKRVPVDENLKIENIVDPTIKSIFENAIKEKSLKDMKKEGGLLYTHPKTGKTIRIRHVRCFQKPTDLLEIKQQSHSSKHDYKNWYYADNAENLFYALYEDEKGNRTFEMLNLFDAIKIKQIKPISKPEDFFEPYKETGRGKNKSKAKLKSVLYKNLKVILYEENIDELLSLNKENILQRVYYIYKFKKDGRIYLQHHLEARSDKELGDGPSKIDFNNLHYRYFISKENFNFAIEGKDFEIKPDGEIIWKF